MKFVILSALVSTATAFSVGKVRTRNSCFFHYTVDLPVQD